MKTIQIAPVDNVAVALCPINAGETVQSGDLSQVVVTEAIPQGHKIAFAFGGEHVQEELLKADGIEVVNGRVDLKKYGI